MEKENFFTNGKQKITPIEIGREMQDSFLQYAMSVIVARALPDVRDGLKPVHRRILTPTVTRRSMMHWYVWHRVSQCGICW